MRPAVFFFNQSSNPATLSPCPSGTKGVVRTTARGTRVHICYDAYMRRTTIFLPDDLHEQLRQEAFRTRLSMAELIRLRLQRRGSAIKKGKPAADPLLRAAGICRGPQLSTKIDEELYGI